MAVIGGIGFALLSVVTAIVVAAGARLVAEDAKEWAPTIAALIVQRAVNKMPVDERAQAEQDWPNRIKDTPGAISKIVVSLRFLRRANTKLRRLDRPQPVGKPRVPFRFLAIAVLAVAIFAILMTVVFVVPIQDHAAWDSFQVAYLGMVLINLSLFAFPTTRTPVVAAESRRWESLLQVMGKMPASFAESRARAIGDYSVFLEESRLIEARGNILRGLALAVAGISFAMLMLTTAFAQEPSSFFLAWGTISIALIPSITLFAFNYMVILSLERFTSSRRLIEKALSERAIATPTAQNS